MGKYMKKSKIAGEVAIMEVISGVRTRAKTLALQKPQSASCSPDATATCYLQLRSRRLEKTAPLFSTGTKRTATKEKNNLNCASGMRVKSSSTTGDCDEKESQNLCFECTTEDFAVVKDASFGDNCFDSERCTRESTPCSLTRDSETIATPPGSTTTRRRSIAAVNPRLSNNIQIRNIPKTYEMDDFFAGAEQQQQRLFINKYNFDIVHDLPLPGRYEWVPIIP